MSRIRRGGYVFVSWKGDHAPRHVHVFRDGRLFLKWDLEGWRPIWGYASRRVLSLICELLNEGRL